MISDEQGQEWVLRKLYDAGWRYYVKNAGGCSFLTTNTPVIFNQYNAYGGYGIRLYKYLQL